MSGFIDTYSVATMGYNGPYGQPFSVEALASLGYYYTVEITEIPDVDVGGAVNPAFVPYNPYAKLEWEKEKKKKFKIKVTLRLNGESYIEEKTVEAVKTPTIDDIKVNIKSDISPKITITLI